MYFNGRVSNLLGDELGTRFLWYWCSFSCHVILYKGLVSKFETLTTINVRYDNMIYV